MEINLFRIKIIKENLYKPRDLLKVKLIYYDFITKPFYLIIFYVLTTIAFMFKLKLNLTLSLLKRLIIYCLLQLFL